MPEQQSKNCTRVCALLHKCMCLFRSLAHCAEDMSGCVFRSFLSLRVLMCVFSSALFGLSVTAVKHVPVWTAGWVHTLSINPPLRVHVLTCVNACLCVSMWRWVVDALFIATAIPLCHQYLICHPTCQRTMRKPPSFPSMPQPEVNIILLPLVQCICALTVYLHWKFNQKKLLKSDSPMKSNLELHLVLNCFHPVHS